MGFCVMIVVVVGYGGCCRRRNKKGRSVGLGCSVVAMEETGGSSVVVVCLVSAKRMESREIEWREGEIEEYGGREKRMRERDE